MIVYLIEIVSKKLRGILCSALFAYSYVVYLIMPHMYILPRLKYLDHLIENVKDELVRKITLRAEAN